MRVSLSAEIAVKLKKPILSPAKVALPAHVNVLGVNADQVPLFVSVLRFARVRLNSFIFTIVGATTSMFPVIYAVCSPSSMICPPELNCTSLSPSMVGDSTVRPPLDTIFVRPGVNPPALRFRLVNVSSPSISKVPLFVIGLAL